MTLPAYKRSASTRVKTSATVLRQVNSPEMRLACHVGRGSQPPGVQQRPDHSSWQFPGESKQGCNAR
eukprot:1149626-Pelagomonas_calceolata.AAC.8